VLWEQGVWRHFRELLVPQIDFEYLNKNVIGSNEPPDLDTSDFDTSDEFVHHVLTEPQSQFYNLDCTNPLFIGGYGSGKTFIKLDCAFRDITQFPGANIALYDPTYDQISINTAPRLEELLVELDMPYKYDKSKHIINLEKYGKIIMRSMNNPERIVGYEVFRSHVDEIGVVHPNRVEDVWNKIVARNRQKVPRRDADNRKVIDIKTRKPLLEQNRIAGYGTPDDGFGFTYQMWGKDPKPGYEYVRAPTHSNRELPDDYIDNLRKIYPDALVNAFIEGIWTNFTSGAIYFTYDEDENHTDYTVSLDPKEQLHIGMDFNVYHMAAVVGIIRMGKLFIVDEFIDLRDTPDMIKAIKNRYPEHNVVVYPDATGDSKSSKGSTLSDHKLLKDAGFTIKARPSNPYVRDRIASVNKAFEDKNVAINKNTCLQLKDSVAQHAYDLNGVPDKKIGHDHPNDAMGYLIHWYFGIKRPQANVVHIRNI
jgi:hypothetical protein